MTPMTPTGTSSADSAPPVGKIMERAYAARSVIPAFNVPYLPMMEAIVKALRDTRTFGLIAVARLEWTKFEAGGVRAIFEEYRRVGDIAFTRLHLDHVPVIDEDDLQVDYLSIIDEALALGFNSVMVDGSRLSLTENIAATRRVVERSHALGVPVEAELGSVLGHEDGPLPPYEELFRTGKGFTRPEDAERFINETGADWLSAAVGSVHGAVSTARRNEAKIHARLNVEVLRQIAERVQLPIVLHGGSGIPMEYVHAAIREGMTKINIGTAIRQPYERLRAASAQRARRAVYDEVTRIVTEDLGIAGNADTLTAPVSPRSPIAPRPPGS